MLDRWVLTGFVLLALLTAIRPLAFERKMSTTLSFDLRRKTKHHRPRNTTTPPPTPVPMTVSDEEMEFSLRVSEKLPT